MTATGRRALSVADLQAGLAAARDGKPLASGRGEPPAGRGEARESGAALARSGASSSAATTTEKGGRRAGTSSGAWEEAVASRRGEPARDATTTTTTTTATRTTATAGSLSVPTVLVLAAHAGAGASSVAVLIGEAAATGDITTRLVDCADPGRSGLAGATDIELGEDGAGWRRGRRGRLEVDRPARGLLDVEDLAAPRPAHVPAAGAALAVVDAGWPAWEVLTPSGWVTGLLRTAQLVLVCRATVPGVRQTEQLLAALPGRAPLVAALGPNRWPGVVTASCGPLLRVARGADRLVCVPLEGRLAVTGLTADPLPKQLTAAGRALVIRLLAGGAGRAPGHPAPAPGRARTSRRKDDR